jgi:hypothetical protein
MNNKILLITLFALSLCSVNRVALATTNDTPVYAKEWIGESGYANCLLVVMSRLQIPTISLHTTAPLPNLEKLTESQPETNKWIKAQELQYNQIDKLTIIRLLAESGGITSETNSLTGTINVHDLVGKDGDAVKRVFHMQLKFTGNEPTLVIIQR